MLKGHDCNNTLLQDFSTKRFQFYSDVARVTREAMEKYNMPLDNVNIREIIAYQITANQLRPHEEKKNKLAAISEKKDYLKLILFAADYWKNKIIPIPEKKIFENIQKIKTDQKHLYLLSGLRGDNLEICMALIKKNGGFALCSDPLTAMTLRKNKIPHYNLFMYSFQLARHYRKTDLPRQLSGLDFMTVTVILRYVGLVKMAQIIVKNNKIEKTVSYADSMIQKIASNLGVPSIQIESLILDENRISSLFFNSDKILVYGEQGKRQLIEYGVPIEKIILTGNPVLDIFAKETRKTRPTPMILYAPSRIHTDDDVFVKKLADFCQTKQYDLVVKLHPKYLNSKIPMVKKISEIKNLTFIKDIQVQKLILQCSCLITDYSSTGIHSQLLGIPTFFCNFTGDDMAFKPPYIQQKMYETHDDLFDNLFIESGISNDPKFANDFNWKNDGHALDRMINEV